MVMNLMLEMKSSKAAQLRPRHRRSKPRTGLPTTTASSYLTNHDRLITDRVTSSEISFSKQVDENDSNKLYYHQKHHCDEHCCQQPQTCYRCKAPKSSCLAASCCCCCWQMKRFHSSCLETTTASFNSDNDNKPCNCQCLYRTRIKDGGSSSRPTTTTKSSSSLKQILIACIILWTIYIRKHVVYSSSSSSATKHQPLEQSPSLLLHQTTHSSFLFTPPPFTLNDDDNDDDDADDDKNAYDDDDYLLQTDAGNKLSQLLLHESMQQKHTEWSSSSPSDELLLSPSRKRILRHATSTIDEIIDDNSTITMMMAPQQRPTAAFLRRRALADGNPYQPALSSSVSEDYTQYCERGILFKSSPSNTPGGKEGWFYAPNVTSRLGRLYYDAKREFKCFYHFLAEPDEHVELAFDVFSNFGKPPDCFYEYVDLYTELPEIAASTMQTNANSNNNANDGSGSMFFPINADALAKGWAGRYCGTVPPRLRVSLNNQLALSFSSEFSESRNTTNMPFRGRYKFIKQAERYRFGERDMNSLFPLCSWIIRSEELPSGVISTPTYPGVYPRDIECVYRLLGRPGERVQLTFIDMDIFFGGEHCPYDKVEVYDGEGYNCTGCARIGIFCGLRHNFTIFSSNEDMTVVFSTRDSKSQHRGFRAFYQFDTKFVRLEPGFVDPHDTSGNVTHIRGTECDVQVRSFGLEGTAGIISSPTRPNRMHQPRNDLIQCQYIIDGKDSPSRLERIVLEFEDFRFGMPAASCASTNHLSVILGAPVTSGGGAMFDANTNKTFCDEYRPTQPLMSYGPRMVLQYYSVDKNYPAYFRARYSFKRDFGITGTPAADVNSCDFLYHYTCKSELDEYCGQRLGQIRSPRHPKKYPVNLNCTYTFQLQQNQELWLVFDVFVFHSSWQKYLSGLQCNEDYVEIYYIYRDTRRGERFANRYCKTTSPAPILSDPDMSAVRVRMVSNRDSGVAVGFRGRYGFRVPAPTQTRPCGGLLLGKTHGVIMSPNFPNKYPVDTKCDWRIEVTHGYKILITINNFELEGNVQSGGCSGAAVQFLHVRPEPAYLNSSQAPYWLPDFAEWQQPTDQPPMTTVGGDRSSLSTGENSYNSYAADSTADALFREMPLELCGPLRQSKRNRDVVMKPTFLSYENKARITFTSAAKAVSNRGFQIAWTRVRVVPIHGGALALPTRPLWNDRPPISPTPGIPPPLVVSNLDTAAVSRAGMINVPDQQDGSNGRAAAAAPDTTGLCRDSDEFLCQSATSVYCLPKATVCDGVYHCSIRTYSDERQCDYSKLTGEQQHFGAALLEQQQQQQQSNALSDAPSADGVRLSSSSDDADENAVASEKEALDSTKSNINNNNNNKSSFLPNNIMPFVIVAAGSVAACIAVFLLCFVCMRFNRHKQQRRRSQNDAGNVDDDYRNNNRGGGGSRKSATSSSSGMVNGRVIAGATSSHSIAGSMNMRQQPMNSSRSIYMNQSLRQLSASPIGGGDNNYPREAAVSFRLPPQDVRSYPRESIDNFDEVLGDDNDGIDADAEFPPGVVRTKIPPTISITTMSNGGVTATYSVPPPPTAASAAANAPTHQMSNRAASRFESQQQQQQRVANVVPPVASIQQHRAQIEQPPTTSTTITPTGTLPRGNGTLPSTLSRRVAAVTRYDAVSPLPPPPPYASETLLAAIPVEAEEEAVWMLASQQQQQQQQQQRRADDGSNSGGRRGRHKAASTTAYGPRMTRM